MPYTITISDLTMEQLRNLNNRLSYVNSGASATSVGDEGKKWRVAVTTSDFNTQQVLANITGVLSQAVAIPYYTINQLPSDIQQRVCQDAIDANIYWDVWQDERNKSFDAICERLDLQWDCDSYDNYYVEETSCDYYTKDIIGASRVIAYIVNRWGNFKKPMYIDKDKHSNFYKLLHKKDAALPQKFTEDVLLTGYCTDYCFYEAYTEFLDLVRKNPTTITLADFCRCLAGHFEKEYQADYEQATSLDYAMEFLCQDNYYTWQGKDITDIVTK
nr:MAG TPA: hypothetical protein [Bacteriophage sp.]